jgi:hypothetical protein
MALMIHISKKNEEKLQKEKYRHYDLFLVAVAQTPPIQHQKSKYSKSEPSKMETVHKRHCRA